MLDYFRQHYARRDCAARTWKAKGRQVVGLIGEGAPEAWITAAGFLPYRLSGDPDLPLSNVRRYLYASYNKGQSERPIRLAWVEAIIEKLLNGTYDFIDYLVIPYTRKEVAQVFTKLRDVARDWPQFHLPETYLLDCAILGGAGAEAYNAARMSEFKAQLEAWSGVQISESVQAQAETDVARCQKLMAQVQALRGHTIMGVDALAIMGSARIIPRADHNAALETLLVCDLPRVFGKRIFVGGSSQDDDTLYRLIESGGGQVVGENHDWGQRIFEPDSRATITYPLADSISATLARAKACGAQGAIWFVHADDAWQVWEAPQEREALVEAGIPSLYLSEQPYRIDYAAIAPLITAFIESLA